MEEPWRELVGRAPLMEINRQWASDVWDTLLN